MLELVSLLQLQLTISEAMTGHKAELGSHAFDLQLALN